MQLIDSLKKPTTDISIYCKILTNDFFQDFRFIDLMNNLIKEKHNYRFAIYCDISLISTNVFIPIFNSIYLSSSNHNVIINNQEDLWLLSTFNNNQYFIMKKKDDDFDYSPYNIKSIQTIREIQ
jgi:hypothetical protein